MTIKLSLKHFPKSEKIANIKQFFSGVQLKFIKMNNNGCGHIEVNNEENAQKALAKNDNTYKNRKIAVKLMSEKNSDVKTKNSQFNDKSKFPVIDEKIQIEKIEDTGRLYIRNLDFSVTEEDVVELFKEYGDLVEVCVPYDSNLQRIKAFGFVTFMVPRDAVSAYRALNQKPFKGNRKLQILPGDEKPEGQRCKGVLESDQLQKETGTSSFKTDKAEQQKSMASSSYNWNALFVNSDVVAQFLADMMGVTKSALFQDSGDRETGSISVRLAQAESQLVCLIEQFLSDNSVRIDRLESLTTRTRVVAKDASCPLSALSSTTFVVKNLSVGVKLEELEELFRQYPGFVRVLLPPYGVTAIVTYQVSQQAKTAYLNCAYMPFKDTVLMLQWAPLDLFTGEVTSTTVTRKIEPVLTNESAAAVTNESAAVVTNESAAVVTNESAPVAKLPKKRKGESEDTPEPNPKKPKSDEVNSSVANSDERTTRVLVKNISFQATLQELEQLFGPFKGIVAIRLPKKPAGGHRGFAFVEFETADQAQCLMDAMSVSTHLFGRRLVLQYSQVA